MISMEESTLKICYMRTTKDLMRTYILFAIIAHGVDRWSLSGWMKVINCKQKVVVPILYNKEAE